jgi:DNA-binding SARP family transcriptional activator
MLSAVRVGVLGAAEARLDDRALDLGTRKQRAVLAALALRRGQAISPDVLVDLLWGERPPAAVMATLQGYVSGLRRALEPDRAPRAEPTVLVTRSGGYALELPAGGTLDADELEAAVTSVHAQLGQGLVVPAGDTARLEQLHAALDRALALWRGTPYAELGDAPEAVAERARLEELRVVALEDRAAAALALGRHATVAGELESLTVRHPLRERLWGLRAIALVRSGRQAEALDVLRQVRTLLDEELGLEPGAELRDLQTAVLRQDPALAWQDPRASPASARASTPSPFAWPLVGRDDELAALVGLLDRSAHEPAFAALTGEPGIGKSRLCAELAEHARAEGVTVVAGRCSQDDGAPPLYPWSAILAALGHDLSPGGGEDSAARFRAWQAIVDTVLDEARERQLLVVLDDLHWADSSTLRVLRLLAERAEEGRLLVVATWRDEPPPTGQLAVVAEMLARRHALRLQLGGLSEDEAREVVGSVAATTPTTREAGALRERTDGNPFFLVEYARLARDRGDLTALLAEPDPPAAVQDVLVRRVATLSESSAGTLRTAGVLGREFDVPTLAELLGADEEAVLDALDPPLAAGLVRESGVDRFRFAHALVRDAVYAALPRSRRARVHARAAAVLAAAGQREGEVARHWLAAGPSYADRAWRAARDAARVARELYAHDEAVELLTAALEVLGSDHAEDRFALLLEIGRCHRQVDDLVHLREVVHEALALVPDDPTRQLEAVGMLVTRGLWQSGTFGQVDRVVVSTLRRCLDVLPVGDSPERCRAMVGLATEIYYDSTPQERTALCEEALAMARRIDDPRLLLDSMLAAPLSIWTPAQAQLRADLTAEAAGLARELGDREALGTALALHANALSELGRVAGLFEEIATARAQAEEGRQLFVQLFLDGLEIAWRSMRGETEEIAELLAHMIAMHEAVDVPQTSDGVLGAMTTQLLWGDTDQVLAGMIDQIEAVQVMPINATVARVLARVGRDEEARASLDLVEDELSTGWWFSLYTLAMTVEAALRLQVPATAASAYAALAPFAGRPACAGSGTIVGVVDMFLAMAARTTGERDLAARHADDAVRLCAEWEIPLAGEWFARVREEFGF